MGLYDQLEKGKKKSSKKRGKKNSAKKGKSKKHEKKAGKKSDLDKKKIVESVSEKLSKGKEVGEGRIVTGITGLDETLFEGIPEGHLVLIAGGTGTGKTIFGLQTANYHASQGKNVLFMSFEESEEQLKSHMESFGWDAEEYINNGNLMIKGYSPYDIARQVDALLAKEKKELSSDIKPMFLPKDFDPDIVVIDSLSALAAAFETKSKGLYRLYLDKIYKFLKEDYCTSFLISETTGDSSKFSPEGVDEFVVDAVIALNYRPGEQQTVRNLNVVKVRGADYRSGKINFDITSKGIVIYPKIPVDRSFAETEFKNRVSSGCSELDEMIRGGFPEGHMVLISGNTGSGKTTFGMQFLEEGIKKGEKGIYINLEESTNQVLKTAKEHGWDFERHKKDKSLKFISPDLIDIFTDRILYQVLHEIQKSGSKRVFIDSISSMISASIDKNQLREFLLQMTGYFKTKGITCIMTYLSEEIFGAGQDSLLGGGASTELRLSSIVDSIILLRYLEKGKSVTKVLSVLKLRGSDHDKSIKEFDIVKEGIKIGGKVNNTKVKKKSSRARKNKKKTKKKSK